MERFLAFPPASPMERRQARISRSSRAVMALWHLATNALVCLSTIYLSLACGCVDTAPEDDDHDQGADRAIDRGIYNFRAVPHCQAFMLRVDLSR